MLYHVKLTKRARKNLEKVPLQIVFKLQSWVDAIKRFGMNHVRKIPGYHDEPLKGDREGQRSIRLNKAYRAFYIEAKNKDIYLISIIEVNKHEY